MIAQTYSPSPLSQGTLSDTLQKIGHGTATAVVLLASGCFTVTPAQSYTLTPPTAQGYRSLGALPAGMVTRDDVAITRDHDIMSHLAVNQFKLQMPAADLDAVQRICNMTTQAFQAAQRLSLDISIEQEDTGPALFLTLDTHGMDFDEQLQCETQLRDAIQADRRLAEAKRYLVISVM